MHLGLQCKHCLRHKYLAMFRFMKYKLSAYLKHNRKIVVLYPPSPWVSCEPVRADWGRSSHPCTSEAFWRVGTGKCYLLLHCAMRTELACCLEPAQPPIQAKSRCQWCIVPSLLRMRNVIKFNTMGLKRIYCRENWRE